jgi:oligopeptide transport system substrate-binding protein
LDEKGSQWCASNCNFELLMVPFIRKSFPLVAIALFVGALIWALSFERLPPADFTFINSTEIQSVDPAKTSGIPEHRIIDAVFEGLYREWPDERDSSLLVPQPALAASHTLSADKKIYTFHLRRNARWSNGDPITSHDFRWSWRRFLHPDIASEYAYELYYLKNAKKYNTSVVEEGDRVEVELADSGRSDGQIFPRGKIVAGVVERIIKPEKPILADGAAKEQRENAEADWKRTWTYVVDVKPGSGDDVQWLADGELRKFSKEPSDDEAEKCEHVLVHFESEVGVRAPDDYTLVVELNNPVPYFLYLAAFYPLYPVHRESVEKYGDPLWTKPENLVTSGPYRIKFRRLRDRIRLEKNPDYWNADAIELNTIDALAVTSETTQLNMYMDRQADWIETVPNAIIPILKQRDDFITGPQLTTYFYRLNVTREPLNDHRVRQALNMAVNKAEICERITRAGQLPARGFVPPFIDNWRGAMCGDYDPQRARELLAAAGFPGGRGMRKLEILYNKSEAHQVIAEVLGKQWNDNLGIEVEFRMLEWGVYQDTTSKLAYDVARGGWVADYPDPITFLNMFIEDGGNNETGWSNEQYEKLLAAAEREPDEARRFEILRDAEAVLLDDWRAVRDDEIREQLLAKQKEDPTLGGMPLIPVYYYVSVNMVQPYVKGFHPTRRDLHPLHVIEVDQEAKRAAMKSK